MYRTEFFTQLTLDGVEKPPIITRMTARYPLASAIKETAGKYQEENLAKRDLESIQALFDLIAVEMQQCGFVDAFYERDMAECYAPGQPRRLSIRYHVRSLLLTQNP